VIGLDTNVLVRFLTQDDAVQSAAASHLIESLTPDEPGVVTSVALAEIVWVLEDSYDVSRSAVAEIIERLLQTPILIVENAEIAWRALAGYRTGAADFADYLIARRCAALGCETVYTFDKKAAREDCGMMLVR
jgi:predicted nucleic-acid-binding protein